MKKTTILIILAFVIQTITQSQSCLPDGIEFLWQSEINSFATNYPECTEIEGDVEISSRFIDNLEGLSQLTKIGGSLKISNSFINPEFTTLNGLENLTSIGKDFTLSVYQSLSDISALKNLTSVGGDLRISSNSSLQYLTGFDNLDSIGGNLSVLGNTTLKNLTALENLTFVGGYIDIHHNSQLTSLNGLENIDASSISNLSITRNYNLSSCKSETICNYLANPNGSILIYANAAGCNNSAELVSDCGVNLPCLPYGTYYFSNQTEIDNFQSNYPDCNDIEGDVIINGLYADEITNLNGLSQITSISGKLDIEENFSITSLEGLENLKTIGGDLIIYHNTSLSSIVGLENLEEIGGSFTFRENHSQVDFMGLGNLESIGENFLVWINDSLINFSGLENLRSVGGQLKISHNSSLTSLNGLDNIEPLSIFDLEITNNPNLSSCESSGICNYLANPSGKILIYENAVGCNNPGEIASLCGIAMPCLPFGDYLFTSQAQIDNFKTNYDNCTAIKGNLSIRGEGITNLNGLSEIEDIEGNLSIYADTSQNSTLSILTGFNNITNVGGDLTVWGQDVLINFMGLENLSTIGGYLRIYSNDKLNDFSGLVNLNSVGSYLSISSNSSLTSLSGLENLNTLGGSLSINDNNVLGSLAGIENIAAATIASLGITNNPSLSYCNAQSICDYLVSPNGYSFIYFNDQGCRSIQEVKDSCGIVFCLPEGITFTTQSEIESFQANYSDCDVVEGTVVISGNSINDLSFLNSLTSINGDLEIYGNDQLVNLSGLENITSVNGSLVIGKNDRGGNSSLTSLNGLENLRIIGGDLRINNNNNLSNCDIKSVCDYIYHPNGVVEISNNASGCSSVTEVLAICSTWVPHIEHNPQFSIFPNPAKKAISISSKDDLSIDQITIYNHFGQIILQKKGIHNNIDISTLDRGLYVIVITSKQLLIREKLIIQ